MMLIGEIHYAPSAVLFIQGLLSGFIGRFCGLYVTKHYGRNSFLVIMLTVVLTMSCGLLIYELATDEEDYHLHALC